MNAPTRIAALFVDCGHCSTPVEDPHSGSFMLTPESLVRLGWTTQTRSYVCADCGKRNTLPALVRPMLA